MPEPKTDKYLRHEAQHMAEFLSRTVGAELCEHPLVSASPGLLALAERARDALGELYQAAGNL